MTFERMREIATMGACGLVARAVLVRLGGVPHLRRDSAGTATHAAVLVNGRFVHLGEDWGLEPCTVEELVDACAYDFDPSRVNLKPGELRTVVRQLCGE